MLPQINKILDKDKNVIGLICKRGRLEIREDIINNDIKLAYKRINNNIERIKLN